ncbi:DUF5134 domain-containing protein [Actinomycetospora atypica]|uniref:DUF5134 domain-containing protein n=1 Tax=Actinomycetospora atypica TaxID=1290095 RepID=A0ABV9YJ22_9PSEU
MFSPTLSLVFTAVFLATAVYSLVRLAELGATGDRDGSRAAELTHLVMSLAMIAMAWAWTGGPTSPSGMLQLVVFGAATLWFATRALTPGHPRAVAGYHVVMNAAMVWMVAAMPQIMGMSTSGDSSGGHHHGGSSPAGAGAVAVATPVWVAVVTWLFAALLLGTAVLWALRVRRPAAEPSCAGRGPDEAAGGSAGGAAVAVRPTTGLGARLDAGCHLLMSLGMAGMLVAML